MTTAAGVGTVSAEDREALRESVAGLVRARSDSAAVRAAMAATPRIDRALWGTLCTEIGIAALAVPEEFGGAGATFAEVGVVLEELGAALSPVPAFSTSLAVAAILIANDADAAQRLLPGIADGTTITTLCWADAAGWTRPGAVAESGLLSGTAHYVLDAESADHLLVLADTPSGVSFHDVDARADGVHITALPTVDPTRALASVTFHDVDATAIATPAEFVGRIRTAAWALLSAEQVGAAARALDLTVAYSKERSQFGRVIGSFQALKHRMADMYAQVETARSISRAAVDAVARNAPEAAELAAASHVYCSEAFSAVVGEAVQLHGGIAITWEHDIQLYFKRAHGSSQLFGQPHEVVAEMATALRT